MSLPNYPPIPSAQAGLNALQAMVEPHGFIPAFNMLAALQAFQQEAGDIFQVSLPRFRLVVMSGSEAARFIYVTHRQHFNWRMSGDAVAHLLRRGILVVDGEEHDRYRKVMEPPLVRRQLPQYLPAMIAHTDTLTERWQEGQVYDMLVEMRQLTLLILFDTLFGVDLGPDLPRLWRPILRAISYISPGIWLFWPQMPRLGYRRHLQQLDGYLYQIIRQRRQHPQDSEDLLSRLVLTPGISDEVIRDQLLTMLIAGHDTGTALLSWTLYLLGVYPQALDKAIQEVAQVLQGQVPTEDTLARLTYLEQVLKESLRLYPPIHASMRRAATDIEFNGYTIDRGTRILFSIYLTHRHPQHWSAPDSFQPQRFDLSSGTRPTAFTFIPFGGGPRNCIGGAYGKMEALVVLARILQKFELTYRGSRVTPHMGATLEPRPGVPYMIHERASSA